MAFETMDAENGATAGAQRPRGEAEVKTLASQDSAADASALSPRRFRKRLAAVRRWRLLANPAPKAAALERWARWRSDAELNVAAVLPDHSPSGQAAAASALEARGGVVTGLTLAAPSFLRGKQQRLSPSTFFGWAFVLRRASRLFVIATAALLLGSLAVMLSAEHVALTTAAAESRITAKEFAARHERTDLFTRNADTLLARVSDLPAAQRAAQARMALGIGAVGLLGALLVWALCVQARRRPARVLVLRPEGRSEGGDLQRLIEKELRPFGHVVALSARPVKRTRVNWTPAGLAAVGGPWRAALIVVTTPFRVFSRILDKGRLVDALVASAQDYRSLARRLMDKTGQNFAAEMTTRETIVAKPTDRWREETARLLLRSSDVVLAEASTLNADDAETLKAWLSPEVRGRVVFVSPAGQAEEAEARLRAAGLTLSHPLALYRPRRGLLDRTAFRETLLAAMRTCGGRP